MSIAGDHSATSNGSLPRRDGWGWNLPSAAPAGLENRKTSDVPFSGPKELLVYAEKNRKLIQIGMSKQIILESGYCRHAIGVVRRFYDAVLAAMPDRLLE